MRPCDHPTGEPQPGCAVCEMYVRSPAHRRAWDALVQAEDGRFVTAGPDVTPAPPRQPRPSGGPGTELRALLKSLGLSASGCGTCGGMADEMDRLGVDGCHARRAELLVHLRKAARKLGWADWFKAMGLAVLQGLAFKLDPTDPAAGLLDEALRRAAQASERVYG